MKRCKMPKLESNYDRRAFVRQMVMEIPKVSLDQILSKWTQQGLPDSAKPTAQLLAEIRHSIKEKYRLKNLDNDLPRKGDGSPDVPELLRIILRLHPQFSEKQALRAMQADGISFSNDVWMQLRHNQPVPEPSVPEPSLDPHQHTGSRAKFVRKKKRK